MQKQQQQFKEKIPNTQRRFYKRKYPIMKTKYIIFCLASALLGWNGYNLIKPEDTFSNFFDDQFLTTQAYQEKFVPNSIVKYFNGNVQKMTRQDCYDIIDGFKSTYNDAHMIINKLDIQNNSLSSTSSQQYQQRNTASNLCQAVMIYSSSNPSLGKINCTNEKWYKLEQYYLIKHLSLFFDNNISLKRIQKSSLLRSILLFIYDLFSLIVFVMIMRKINLKKIYLPSFFSIFNTQAHYNIIKILNQKSQKEQQQKRNCIQRVEQIFDIIFFIYFLFNTFIFPLYVIGQIFIVFYSVNFLCNFQPQDVKEYQLNIKTMMDSASQEQNRNYNIFSSQFKNQYEDIRELEDQCKYSSDITFYLFSSFRQTLITIQLILVIVKAVLNIITIIKKYCTKKFIDYYELREDNNLHAVPYVGEKRIFPFDNNQSINIENESCSNEDMKNNEIPKQNQDIETQYQQNIQTISINDQYQITYSDYFNQQTNKKDNQNQQYLESLLTNNQSSRKSDVQKQEYEKQFQNNYTPPDYNEKQ